MVRPPEQEDYTAVRDGRTIEIVRTLAQISDKLKRSEAERYELLSELREYRKALNMLEEKAGKSEKAYQSLEQKVQGREQLESEISQRQARFEKALKDTEEKFVKTAAGQALLDKKITDAEGAQAAINQRLDESLAEQTRLDRQLEKVSEEKSRMLRKVERLEEIAMETQESLRARALVLLTDQSAAAQTALPQIPAWSDASSGALGENEGLPWWRRSVRMQSVGMASMIVAALLLGWAINQVQQPEIPQIAVLENGGLARLNMNENRWEAVSGENGAAAPAETGLAPAEEPAVDDIELPPIKDSEDVAPDAAAPEAEEPADDTLGAVDNQAGERVFDTSGVDAAPAEDAAQPESILPLAQSDTVATPSTEKIMEYNDDELLAALENDPDQLAARLNDIAPGVSTALELGEPVSTGGRSDNTPRSELIEAALAQNPSIEKAVLAEKGKGPLNQRMQHDPKLPRMVSGIERNALEGNGEAQHDLAAIYTAGQAGTQQNFERAAQWFREAADNGVANARYNLGVLYHQGLGVKRDLGRALYWYREAARLGHPEAEYNLGIAYIEGIGTKYNAPIAGAFFERAANNGIMEAAYNLGLIHENGLLGKTDNDKALLWYKIAADQGNVDAQNAIKQLSKTLKIGPKEVEARVQRMQNQYAQEKGRKAGPTSGAGQSL